ncbi:MAG: multidrug efflux SMR transporter [Pseudomonadales bacterium]|nr:multidrug efflux SMR transporter [Pseudomonadales bacterium]
MAAVNPWLILSVAIALEIAGTVCLKLADGFSHIVPSVLTFLFYGLAFVSLILAIKRVDISVAYAIWSGVGTAAIAVIGMTFLGEPFSWHRVFWVAVIVVGVVGLQLGGPARA